VLYRPGTTHIVNGIECEARVFDEYSYLHNLTIGWSYSPESCYTKKELTDTEIRKIAKEKNIKHWHNKNINRLKKEVEEWQPEI